MMMGDGERQRALERFDALRMYLEDGVPLATIARRLGLTARTVQRWLRHYRAHGLAGLGRRPRADAGRRRLPADLERLIEGLALRTPPPSVAAVHRKAAQVAAERGWPVPSYARVYDIVRHLDPGLVTLAHDGPKAYKEEFDLVHRREAGRPNEVWQADHTLLDLWTRDDRGRPVRPWLCVILDDHSRAIAGYAAPN